MSTVTATKTKTYDLAYIAIFAVLIAICSWISIPMTVPFTLQTFGVFMAVGVLCGKRGSLAVLVYILLGVIGVPVFAGFSGGLGILLNNTGGYIIGFLFSALVMWAMESLWGKKPVIQILSMVVGLIVCYAMGTIWFMVVYTRTTGAVGIGTVLGWCEDCFGICFVQKGTQACTNAVKKNVRHIPFALITGCAWRFLSETATALDLQPICRKCWSFLQKGQMFVSQ